MNKIATHHITVCLLALVLFAFPCQVRAQGTEAAQVFETGTGVDTLSLAERISVRTNMLDWVLAIPNVGVEFDLGSTNYSRWAVGVNVRSRWVDSHTFKPGTYYSLTEIRVEARNYWRTKQLVRPTQEKPDPDPFYGPHSKIWDKAMSLRRSRVKHPRWTWYRGLYLAYDMFSLAYLGHGRQGKAIVGGVTYGFVKPLYFLPNGNSIDLDFGVSAGIEYASLNKLLLSELDNCYMRTSENYTKILPTLTEARVGLIYRFGSYPITKKYRYRIEADARYRDRLDSIALAKKDAEETLRRNTSIYNMVYGDYKAVYDSVARINADAAAKNAAEQAARQKAADAAAKVKEAEDKLKAKEAKKAEEQKAKEAKKAEKNKAKEQSTAEGDAPKTDATEGEAPKQEETKSEETTQQEEPKAEETPKQEETPAEEALQQEEVKSEEAPQQDEAKSEETTQEEKGGEQ